MLSKRKRNQTKLLVSLLPQLTFNFTTFFGFSFASPFVRASSRGVSSAPSSSASCLRAVRSNQRRTFIYRDSGF